jgi:hypothetical protein
MDGIDHDMDIFDFHPGAIAGRCFTERGTQAPDDRSHRDHFNLASDRGACREQNRNG